MSTSLNLFIALWLSANTTANPETPASPSFDASFFVKKNQQIQVSVDKYSDERLWIVLFNAQHKPLYEHEIPKKERFYRVALTVDDLTEGQYEVAVTSKQHSINKTLTINTRPVQSVNRVLSIQ